VEVAEKVRVNDAVDGGDSVGDGLVRAVGVSGGGFASLVGAVGRLISMKQLRASRGTSGGSTMTTPGGAGTAWTSPRARRTGFYHGVGAFSLLGSDASCCPYSPKCVEEEFCELRRDGGSAAKGGPGSLEEPALPHYSLVGVHSTHVARDVFDGCLHHRPVVGGGMDHRSISGGYAHVGDPIACLVEEHQVSRLS
jgi:hypothetical protein